MSLSEANTLGVDATGREEPRALVRNSWILACATFVSVLSSFSWDLAIAARLGIGAGSDAFYFAYTVPSIAMSVVYIATYSVLIPPVARRLSVGDGDAAWGLFFSVANAIVVTTILIASVCAVGSLFVMRYAAPGFNPSTERLAGELSALLFIAVIPGVMFELGRAALYAAERILVPTILIVGGHLLTTSMVFGLTPHIGAHSAAAGVLAAKMVQCAAIILIMCTIPGLRFTIFRRGDAEVPRTLAGLASPLSGMGARRSVLIVERAIASTLPAGSLTALSYGSRLGVVVATVFFQSITTAAVRPFVVAIAAADVARVRRAVLTAVKLVTFISIPAVILLVVLSEPLVLLLFQHGEQRTGTIVLTAEVVAIYSLSMLFAGHVTVVQNFLYASHARRSAAVLQYAAAALNLVLDLALVAFWGAHGIAIAWSITSAAALLLGYGMMWPRAGGWPFRELGAYLARLAVAGTACAVAAYAVLWLCPTEVEPGIPPVDALALLVVGAAVAGAVFLAISFAAERGQAVRLVSVVRRRFRRTSTRGGDMAVTEQITGGGA